MIKRKIRSLRFHISRYLFEHYAIPKMQNEKISKVLLKKYLPRKPVIIDCGAHNGNDSNELLQFLKGTVHCFERVGNLYERLKRRTVNRDGIYTYQLALSDETGTSEFYVSDGDSDASSSLLAPQDHLKDHPGVVFQQKIIVATKTLDHWAEENNIAKVDLLWLDMQGFELNMLKASSHVLDTVKVIHTEVSTRETYKGVAPYETYKNFLEQKGFEVVIEAIPKGWDMGNVLFVRK